MKDDSASFNGLEESFGFFYASLDLPRNDEVAQSVFYLDKCASIRGGLEDLCRKLGNEIDAIEKMHQDERIRLIAEIEIKMAELQDELAKRTDELKNMQVEQLAQKTFNDKFEQFLGSIHDRKFFFLDCVNIRFLLFVKYS